MLKKPDTKNYLLSDSIYTKYPGKVNQYRSKADQCCPGAEGVGRGGSKNWLQRSSGNSWRGRGGGTGVGKCSKTGSQWWWHNSMNLLKITELYYLVTILRHCLETYGSSDHSLRTTDLNHGFPSYVRWGFSHPIYFSIYNLIRSLNKHTGYLLLILNTL